MQPVLGRCHDPGLVLTVERVGDAAGVVVRRGGVRRVRDLEPAEPGGTGDDAGAGHAEDPPPGERGGLAHEATTPVIFDSGSASALTASESSLRCASVTVS